jgi:septum formation protein
MQEAGYDFTVVSPRPEAETTAFDGEPAEKLVARLAVQKAHDVASRTPAGLIIGCDTVAECGGEILGKPTDRDDARRMLALLRSREHRVYSGLCLWRRPGDQHRVAVDVTRLVMDPLSNDQVEEYLDTDQWQGKAGAFGYQDGLDWVHILAGSGSNVVGLPMELLGQMLNEFGVFPQQ